MSALTTYLNEEPIELDDRIEMKVPGMRTQEGRLAAITKDGRLTIQPWSPFLGRYALYFQNYAPQFCRRLTDATSP